MLDVLQRQCAELATSLHQTHRNVCAKLEEQEIEPNLAATSWRACTVQVIELFWGLSTNILSTFFGKKMWCKPILTFCRPVGYGLEHPLFTHEFLG